ncbi:hypothetical protein [Prosthecomicrobium sp. N25]|uniref:hypothetical protein n=1 Tax=Prosthecomicrobium sp. N25 TaxID=3129254 RepID=UPI0030769981
MSPASARTDELLAKSKLTVGEITEIVAERVAKLPSVRTVSVEDVGEISVDLVGGKRIEVQTLPVAHAFNESMATRRVALDQLLERCA